MVTGFVADYASELEIIAKTAPGVNRKLARNLLQICVHGEPEYRLL